MNNSTFTLDTYLTDPNETDTYPPGAVTDTAIVEDLLERCPHSDFIESITDWWLDKGFLTEAQFAKLEEIAGGDFEEGPRW